MSRYESVEVSGVQRAEALAACEAQMARWGLKMPAVEPIPLDFGLGTFRQIGETEFWIANEKELGYCGKFLFMFKAQRCPCHCHRMKHETFYVLKGRIEMTVDDRTHVMEIGDTLVMEAGRRHTFLALEATLILEVSLPSVLGDNFFDDKRIGKEGVI